MAESTQLVCPKCKSSALGATKINVPTSSAELKEFIKVKCLTCGTEFSLAAANKKPA